MNNPRRQVAYVGAWNTLQLDYRNPYVVTFWSIAYAGLGHILLDRYFRGFILLAGEILLNFASNVNTAIFHTLSGRFDLARNVLDMRWFALYMTVYCFAIFDSYHETIVINNAYRLADRENAQITSFKINANSFTILNSISPYMAALLSAVMPGVGCFFIQRMNRAFYLMAIWTFMAALSGVFTANILTFSGQFEAAKQALNIQWFMNLPSIWLFSVYEAYQCSLENNRLFRRELRQYLQAEYQNAGFVMPGGER